MISYQIDSSLVTQRSHAKIMREVNRSVLERDRDANIPRHFLGGATERYGYQPRSSRYTAKKRKRFGHSIPLVYTGRLRDAIKSGVKVTATQNRGTLKSRGYFPMKQQLRGEIERVMPFENEELAKWALNKYTRLAKSPEYRRQRRQKGKG